MLYRTQIVGISYALVVESCSKRTQIVLESQLEYPRRRQQNRMELYALVNTNSEAELQALDVPIVLLKLLTDTKHRAASLRQQSYLFYVHATYWSTW